MTKMLKFVGLAGLVCIAVLLLLSGCGGGKTITGSSGKYTLELVVEKNLDDGQDYLYAKFLRDGIAVVGGYIKVDGDSVVFSASGKASKMYSSDHFTHGATVQIMAVDPDSGFAYSDAIVMPSEFHITDFVPNQRLWQGVTSTVRFDWTGATNVSRYMVSVTPSTPGSNARGLAEVVPTSQGRSFTFTQEAFLDAQTNQIINDNYHVRVIGYNRNFVERPNADYTAPSLAFDQPISEANISGAISAVVVSVRDSIRVELTQ